MKFKVIAVSENTDSFGLRGMILVSKKGKAWQVGANEINLRERDEVIEVPVTGRGQPNFSALGFEVPTPMPDLPRAAVREVWQSQGVPS